MTDPRGAPVGLDFGMSNSLLVYYDPQRGGLIPLRDEGHDTPWIPTVVARRKNQTFFGYAAQLIFSTATVVMNFKVGLPGLGADKAAWRRDERFQAARTFLHGVFDQMRGTIAPKSASRIVATAPDAWTTGLEQGGLDALRAIIEEGVPDTRVDFVSEPVAAAAYFAYMHRQETGRHFHGHVLVYDHGGSTLDISVVRLLGGHIGVVTNIGSETTNAGGAINQIGGVDFDKAVLRRIEERDAADHMTVDLDATEGSRWMLEFEQQKRRHQNRAEQAYERFLSGQLDEDEEAFLAVGNEVAWTDLFEVFESDFAPRIEAMIDELVDHARQYGAIKFDQPERFQFVVVGGFSEFYPLRRRIVNAMRERGMPEEVFDRIFTKDDRRLAVAKGAALIAAGEITLDETAPFTFGIVTYDIETGESYHRPLIVKGAPLTQYAEPRFYEEWLVLREPSDVDKYTLMFFIDQLDRRVELPAGEKLHEVLPQSASARWRFGVQVVGGAVSVVIDSFEGARRPLAMGRLLGLLARAEDQETPPRGRDEREDPAESRDPS